MSSPEQEFHFQFNNKKQGGKPKSIIWGTHIIQGRKINYEEEENLEIENFINLDMEEIISGLNKIMKENVDNDNDFHSISSNNDTVMKIGTQKLLQTNMQMINDL